MNIVAVTFAINMAIPKGPTLAQQSPLLNETTPEQARFALIS